MKMKKSILYAMLLAPLAMLSAPVSAQSDEAPTGPAASEAKVNQLIIYGDDECPPSKSDDEITVCGRMPEQERYRVPMILRDNPNSAANLSWAQRVESLERVGRFGTDSCSPVGLGGFTGCTQSLVRGYNAEKTIDNRVAWTKLVAAERARRAGLIDAQADEVEAQLAKEETERVARAQTSDDDPATAAADAEPLPLP
jgi:hypothetical protein